MDKKLYLIQPGEVRRMNGRIGWKESEIMTLNSHSRFTPFLFAKILLLLLLVLFVLVVLVQANPLNALPGRDSGFFMYAGNQILKGKLLYVDIWDSKGPGIFYANALGLLLVRGSRWGIWFLEFIVALTSTLLGYKIARTEWSHGAALLGAMLWLFCLNIVLQKGNLTEEYSLFFSFVALFVFWKMSGSDFRSVYGWILLGGLLAINFLFRANNIGVIFSLTGAFFVSSLLSKNLKAVFKPAAAFFLGIFIIFALVAAYFYRLGNFQQMIQASILYNVDYAGAGFNLAGTLMKAIELMGWVLLVPLTGYLTIVWYFLKTRTMTPLLLFGLIDWPLELVLSSLSGRMYFHYYICWLPVIWLLSAFAYSVLGKKLFSNEVINLTEKAPWLVCLVIALFCFRPVLDSLDLYRNSVNILVFQRNNGVELINPVALYVRQNSQADDTLLVWGVDGGINFQAQRDAPTPYVYYPLLVDSSYSVSMADQFYKDLVTRRPAYIVDIYARNYDNILSLDPAIRAEQVAAGKGWGLAPKNISDVFAFVEKNYFLEKKIGKALIFKLQK